MEFSRFAFAMMGHFLASLLYVLRRLHIVNAVVDTSSIIEHREELRELWEKRMMADDNQSSPSSTVAEKPSYKPSTEEGAEEAVVKKSNSENEVQVADHKLSNGHATKAGDEHIVEEDGNANHIQEKETLVQAMEAESTMVAQKIEADQDNNNCADSLEANPVDDYVEEKTYTSKLETSLVVKQVVETTTTENVAHTVATATTEEIKVVVEETAVVNESVSQEETVTSTSVEETDGKDSMTSDPIANEVSDSSHSVKAADEHQGLSMAEKVVEPEQEIVAESSESIVVYEEASTTQKIEEISQESQVVELKHEENPKLPEFESLQNENTDDDGFVPLEECLPKVENPEQFQDLLEGSPEEGAISEQKIETTNGHAEPLETLSAITPTLESAADDKPSHPEMEQFVKSGGVKRIIPGVQKTEQPYSTCTTETKIAMEIREMREREEELRQMREQAALSPVVSPVPPKSPSIRSPSPSVKESPSPTPSGCGYRVSSVFGHKGTTSPSPPVIADEERKGAAFKGAGKETAVEKEIRLAREREEELRKQKGLPEREDDSYVKPSQVKSSQVRVFGKTAGSSNAVKQAATAKIQMEIEEQTQREMALRESGSIQTISQERTDAKVAKLKTPEPAPVTNGNSHPVTNGNSYTNGRSSPDTPPYKRGSPSPTGARPASIFSQTNGKANISMHKFISSKGKEATFSAPRNGLPFVPKEENRGPIAAPMVKLKRNVSVESKIQQEILEMKQREEELKKLHLTQSNGDSHMDDNNGIEHELNQKNNLMEYENGNELNEEDMSPRHNKLIAQWEQRIQKAES